MKKILMIIAVTMMTAMNVNAQSAGDWSFSGRLGGNLSTLTDDDDAKWKLDLSVGMGVNYMITDQLAASVEVNHNLMGYKSELLDKKCSLNYFHVPVLAKYYVAPWLALQAGPQIGFLTSAKRGDVSFKNTCEKIEFSIPIGAAIEIPVKSDDWMNNVVVDLRYHLGLTKINKNGTHDHCNRGFLLTVGYKFEL